MKVLVFAILTHAVWGTLAITVPPVWPQPTPQYQQVSGYYKRPHSRPSRENVYKNHQPPNYKNTFKTSPLQSNSHWVPITPAPVKNYPVYHQQSFITHPPPVSLQKRPHVQPYRSKNSYQPNPYQNANNKRSNYVTHADKNVPFSPIVNSHIVKVPPFNPDVDESFVDTPDQKLEDDHEEIKPNYEAPASVHEIPKDVPTKPIYPGVGHWAIPGLKHKPHVSNHKYTELEESDKNADGYDIFERGEERFEKARGKFKFDLDNHAQKFKTKEDSPKNNDEKIENHETKSSNHKPQENHEAQSSNQEEDSDEYSETGFRPHRLYAQVRKVETKQHLPRSEIDPEEAENAGRLREVIKDSKISTVYSEEGYEDSAYDHAGRQKKAELQQGHAHRGEGVETLGKTSVGGDSSKYANQGGHNRGRIKFRRTKNKNDLSKINNYDNLETYHDIKKKVEEEDKQHLDADTAASEQITRRPVKKITPQKNLHTSKDLQKIQIKSSLKNGNDVNMEIHTEVKIMNGDKKKHKFVKIVPSFKTIEADSILNDPFEVPQPQNHKRVKRYDREKLSRIYIRKRPNYYWKKQKINATKPQAITKKVKAEYTTVANGKISTTTVKSSSTTTKQFVPVALKIRTRQKRDYHIDFPKLDVPLDKFVDVSKLPDPTNPPAYSHIKYPYFQMKSKVIHEYSPLRYSEDMKKIPQKSGDAMAFYESRTSVECPVIEEGIDPVPDRIKNKELNDEDEGGKVTDPDGPRLGGLGDKIDCLKVKYFGENPLDSPLFAEDIIELPVPPIFRAFNKKTDKQTSAKITRRIDNAVEENDKISNNADTKTEIKIIKPVNSANLKQNPTPIKKTQIKIIKPTEINSKEKMETEKTQIEIVTPIKNINLNENVNLKAKEPHKKIIKPKEVNESNSFNKTTKKRDLKTLGPIVVGEEDTVVVTSNPVNIQAEAVLKPPYTFKEMVQRLTEKQKVLPNNIYDQINLIEKDDKDPEKRKILIIYNSETTNQTNPVENGQIIASKINSLMPTTNGYIVPRVSDVVPVLSNLTRQTPNDQIINLLPENFTEYDLLVPKSEDQQETPDSYLPQSESVSLTATFSALTDQEKIVGPQDGAEKPTYLPIMVPVDNQDIYKTYTSQPKFASFIFDISKYLPQIKNHKILTSEVQYKDEIKPSEQMNVYSDVLKSINISTQEMQGASSDNSQPITVKLHVSNSTKIKHPKRRIRIRTTTVPSVGDFETTSKVNSYKNINEIDLTQKPVSSLEKITPQVFPTDKPSPLKILPHKIKNMINQYSNSLLINVPDINYSGEMSTAPGPRIAGLAPPSRKYRTILPIIVLNGFKIRKSRNINTYYVAGLRPPPQNQEALTYSDFIPFARKKRDTSSQRKPIAYTEIVRSRPAKTEETDDEEEEEDLRPRKRVYEIKPISRTTTTEREEEVLYLPETEAPAVEKPYTQPPILERPTGLPDYIKIIDKLHDYRFKNNITTTLPEQETTTANPRATTTTTARTQMVAESVNVRRGEPAYLQIIDHLHDLRKENEDKNPTTTTEEAEVLPAAPVKNSNPYLVPEAAALTGKPSESLNENTESDESHVRNLSAKLRTKIDTSKYKTIERGPVVLRHNLSSRYNADDETLPLERMFTTKMPVMYTTTMRDINIAPLHQEILERNTKMPVDEEEPSPTTPEIKVEIIVTQSAENEEPQTTTRAPRRKLRTRTRTTSSRNTQTTANPSRRRRPVKNQPTTTTTEEPVTLLKSASIITRRRVRPKTIPENSYEIPPNHKKEYVPVTEPGKANEPIIEEQTTHKPAEKKKRRLEKLHERRVSSEYETMRIYDPDLEDTPTEPTNNKNVNKKSEYEIVGEIRHPEMRHGGNYKHVNDAPVKDNQENKHKNDDLLVNSNIKSDGESQQYLTEIQTTEVSEKISTWKPNYHINRSPRPLVQNKFKDLQDEGTEEREKKIAVQPPARKPKIIKDPSKRMYFYAKI